MILKALYDYYHAHKSELPSEGRQLKEIGFVIVLDMEGNFLRFEDNRNEDKKTATKFLVKCEVQRSSGSKANYLYDNASYVLGYFDQEELDKQVAGLADDKKEEKCCSVREKAARDHSCFREEMARIAKNHPDNRFMQAVQGFYKDSSETIIAKVSADPLWPEITGTLNKKSSILFSFRLEGDTEIIVEKDDLLSSDTTDDGGASEGRCLVTGLTDRIVLISSSTMIPGSLAIAKLVSFQVNSGYDSYGKVQGYNAPIGVNTEFAYSTALRHLLRSESRNKILLGDRTFVFWSSGLSEVGKELESGLSQLLSFDSHEATVDDVEPVRDKFRSIYSGYNSVTSNDRFYILGLSPNSARIAVVHWTDLPLDKFGINIERHFIDMEVVDTRKEKRPYAGIRSMLSAVTQRGKSSEALPNLPEAVAKSIFQGIPYPYALFASCIRRIKADGEIRVARAAIIKAYLNRKSNKNQQKLTPMLDPTNREPSYLCGRLFAVIEKMQENANNIRTVGERYLNSASATPAVIFPRLLKLANHYLPKMSKGQAIHFEKQLQEIIDQIGGNFPIRLSLEDQGRFFLGYYHQRADYFKPKSENEVEKL